MLGCRVALATALAAGIFISGCAPMTERRNGIVKGAAGGAALGAAGGLVLGSLGGDCGDSAVLVSLAAGAVLGVILGASQGAVEAGEEIGAVPPPLRPDIEGVRASLEEISSLPDPETATEEGAGAEASGENFGLRGIQFEFAQARIPPEAIAVLEEAVALLEARPRLRVVVEGHTCTLGTEAYNKDLSERRALAVYRYLVDRGISPERLEVVGRGEIKPLADNNTPEARRMNRRVELRPMQ